MVERYYVVQTKPQRELLAISEIKNQGFVTFLPMIQRQPLVKRGMVQPPRVNPLFPKYIFVLFDKDSDNWRSLNGTRGVIRVMCMNNEQPSPVPLLAMTRLLSAGELIVEERAQLPFNLGDVVEFVEGSMKGRRGLVESCAAERVTLLLSLLGGHISVQARPGALKYVGKE